MHKIVFFSLLLIMSSCQNVTSSDDIRLGQEFELDIGEKASIDNGMLTVTFKDVNEDSRCPEGVTCFWAGNAQVALIINGSAVTLNTYLEPLEIDVQGYHIDLISLNPYPVYEKVIDKDAYVATLVVDVIEN